MPFDETWETIFRSRGWGRYPSEEVVRFVARRFPKIDDRQKVRILDLGCGGGANTWFLARDGFTVTAVDGSAAAVAQTRNLLKAEACTAEVTLRDFIDLSFPDAAFDAVLDCAAIQHNPWNDITAIHQQVFRTLKPGGWFWGMMLTADSTHGGDTDAAGVGDVRGFRAGSMEQGVLVHLFSRDEVDRLLVRYDTVSVDTVDRTDGGGAVRIAQFVVAARKPPMA